MRLLAIRALTFILAAAEAGSQELSPKPLPGRKPCPYPPQAQKEFVAGPVEFMAQVRPDGSVESVHVSGVPLPRLGFEDGVRACVSEWRFDAAPADVGLRWYRGQVRFRLDTSEEAAIRKLLETLADAWNSADMEAVQDLALRAGDTPKSLPSEIPPLREQLQVGGAPGWRMRLEPEFKHLKFLGPDAVSVSQPIRKVFVEHQTGEAAQIEALTLDVFAAKGSRGWRLVRVSPVETVWAEGIRVGGGIREPRKIKDAKPRYPDAAKGSRIQGVVILDCLITPAGKVTAIRVLRGIPLLDAAAIEAVRQWEYAPTLVDGTPVPVIMTVTVNFRLERSLLRTDEGFSAEH